MINLPQARCILPRHCNTHLLWHFLIDCFVSAAVQIHMVLIQVVIYVSICRNTEVSRRLLVGTKIEQGDAWQGNENPAAIVVSVVLQTVGMWKILNEWHMHAFHADELCKLAEVVTVAPRLFDRNADTDFSKTQMSLLCYKSVYKLTRISLHLPVECVRISWTKLHRESDYNCDHRLLLYRWMFSSFATFSLLDPWCHQVVHIHH